MTNVTLGFLADRVLLTVSHGPITCTVAFPSEWSGGVHQIATEALVDLVRHIERTGEPERDR